MIVAYVIISHEIFDINGLMSKFIFLIICLNYKKKH